MRHISLVALLVLCSCGRDVCQGADGISTRFGFCYFTNGLDVDMDQVHQVIDTVEEECQAKFGRCNQELAQSQYSDTNLNFIATEEIMLEQFDAYAFVDYQTGEIIDDTFKVYFVNNECLTVTALAHEWIHVVNMTVDGTPKDDGHSAAAHPVGWFVHPDNTAQENAHSLETIVFWRLWEEMCHADGNVVDFFETVMEE